jgi:DDE superfamily endonuclease
MMPDLSMMRDVRERVSQEVFGRRRDGLQNLLDALLMDQHPRSLVHLSLAPGHERGSGSRYDALNAGSLDVAAARRLVREVTEELAAGTGSHQSPPLYALDASAWPRPDAETSPERTFCHPATARSGGPPVTPGYDFTWLVQVDPAATSWVRPQDVRRVAPQTSPSAAALAVLGDWLTERAATDPTPSLAVDSRYDLLHLHVGLGELAARVTLVGRLATNRVFFAAVAPTTLDGAPTRQRHGDRFALADPTTHPPPSATGTGTDGRGDLVTLRAWSGYHPVPKNRLPWRTDAGRVPLVSGTLIEVTVERSSRASAPLKPLWLWWVGSGALDLTQVWQAYLRRFAIEHFFRFLKQHLAWTLPHLRQPAAAEHWSWLVLLADLFLGLARPDLLDAHLPWERPAEPSRLTPSRALRAFATLWLRLGTPAQPPRPAGRSPGRPPGRRSSPAPRFPVVRAAA